MILNDQTLKDGARTWPTQWQDLYQVSDMKYDCGNQNRQMDL